MKVINAPIFIALTCAISLVISITACNSADSKSPKTPVENTNIIAKTDPPPAVFEKLVGTWFNPGDKSFERWTKNDNGTYHSVVYRIKAADTSWNEDATIYPSNGKWVFKNNVKGQNDNKAIGFTSIWINDNAVQFSNPEHDFPTDINYTVINTDTTKAFIIGPNNKGGKDTIRYLMVRN